MKFALFLFLVGAAVLGPAAATAQTHPLVNSVLMQQTLQQQMQSHLNAQQRELRSQQDLSRADVRTQLLHENLQLQSLQLQQQLNLLRLQQQLRSLHIEPNASQPATHKAR